MRGKTVGKTVRLSSSIQLFSGLFALAVLFLVFGSSYIENRLMNECQSVLEEYGRLAEAQTQLTDICSDAGQYLIYTDFDARERLSERQRKLEQLLNPIGEESLADSDSRFYYRTLQVMLGTFYSRVNEAAKKDTVYSLYFEPSLGIKKQGEAAGKQLSELTTAFLKYRSTSYNMMLVKIKKLNLWRNVMAGILAVCTIGLAYYRFRQGASESGRVIARAQLLAQGNWNLPDLDMGRYVEINEIVAAFNHTKNSICEYIENLKETAQIEMDYAKARLTALKKEQEVKDWQYRALQMQINPHFLFNTLNVISRTALLGRTETTVLLVESISNIMRYSIGNKTGEARLSEEWDVLKSYVDIQHTRFQDRIRFTMEADERVNLDNLKVPPLILQPLVENSIHHGMAQISGDGEIAVSVRPCAQGAAVIVRDNGKGIPSSVLKRLRLGAYEGISGDSAGIGMQNVIQRMEYFFGQPGLVCIESSPEMGTSVTVIIPAERRHGDESGNCG